MDTGSWIHGYAANSNGGGNSGFMCGYAASCIPSVLQRREAEQQQQQHDLLFSSQIQQHLTQIRIRMSTDEVEPAVYGGAVPSGDISSVVDDFDFLPNLLHAAGDCSFPSSSSTSSSFRSASLSCSPEISSTAAQVFVAPVVSSFPEVSSQVPLVLPYDDQHHHEYAVNFHDIPAAMAPGGTSTSASAFKRYDRYLGPQRRLSKPACGQRMFKTAMSVLAKMDRAMRYSHQQQQQQQYYYQQQQESAGEPSGNQLQHMISERKRREKLNDSFHALKTVLPPGSRKDKTSILITARDYVSSLKSKVCELEEKNQALQAQLARRATSSADPEEDQAEAGEKVEIQIMATEGDRSGVVCMVKITGPARSNTTDMVLRTLRCLKDQIGEDVSLVSMTTCEDGDGPHRASLTLHLKSASGAKWDEKAVREAVTKAVANTPASPSASAETTTATHRGDAGAGRSRGH